jgi:hypothetical protein
LPDPVATSIAAPVLVPVTFSLLHISQPHRIGYGLYPVRGPPVLSI